MNEFHYADIIILALIAIFIVLRLRSTLGKDIGHKPDLTTQLRRQLGDLPEEKTAPPGQPAVAEEPSKREKAEQAARESIGDASILTGIDAIIAADSSFSISEFIDGAKGAFEWVLKAYNTGDLETLKQLLAPSIFEEFRAALEEAKKAPAKLDTTLVAITDAQILAASLEKTKARITLRILSQQIQLVRDAEGNIIEGDASKVQTVEDEWIFERDVKSRNPNWIIMDT